MGQLAAPLSIAATGLSAAGAYSQGMTHAANDRTQGMNSYLASIMSSEQAKLAADTGVLKATQTAGYMAQRTAATLGNIDAVLATTGATDNSPSSWAVKNRFEEQADLAKNQTVSNITMQAQSDKNAAALYQMSALRAMSIANGNASADEWNGILGAGGSILKGLAGMNWG
jgi:hypothetical protein